MENIGVIWTIILIGLLFKIVGSIYDNAIILLSNWLQDVKQNMSKKDKVYMLQDDIESLSSVQRTMTFFNHNGGDRISPSSPMRVSADYGGSPYINDLQNLSVDRRYIKLLMKAIEDGYVEFRVDDEKESFLKEIYQREDIQYARIYFLGNKYINRNIIQDYFNFGGKIIGMNFISVGSKQESIPDNDLTYIEKKISAIKELYNE